MALKWPLLYFLLDTTTGMRKRLLAWLSGIKSNHGTWVPFILTVSIEQKAHPFLKRGRLFTRLIKMPFEWYSTCAVRKPYPLFPKRVPFRTRPKPRDPSLSSFVMDSKMTDQPLWNRIWHWRSPNSGNFSLSRPMFGCIIVLYGSMEMKASFRLSFF